MIDVGFLNQIGKFNLVMKKKVLSQYSGERKSSNVGEGKIFSDYREYIAGDDFRQIDWKVYGRTDKFYIKRFEEEKNLTLHVLLDASASMDFGKNITKYEYGSMIGLGFAYLASKDNERFEFSTFADEIEFIKARRGKNAIIEILDFLNKKKLHGKSNFYDSLHAFKRRIKSRSMIVIISDFLFKDEELEQVLQMFRKSEIFVIQVLDPEELKFSMAGDFMLKDAEQGNIIRTFISNRLRSTYRENLEKHIAKLKQTCTRSGARFLTVTTDKSIFDTFYEVFR